jgi:hypothetical protein
MAIGTSVLKPARMAIPASVDSDASTATPAGIPATLDRGKSMAIFMLQYPSATQPFPCSLFYSSA